LRGHLRFQPVRIDLGRLFALALGLAPVFLALGCSFECLFVHTLTLELPVLPASWEGMPRLSYSVRWVDDRGEEQVLPAEGSGQITIRVARGRPQAILAYPFSRGIALRPAAALYPFGLEVGGEKLPSPEADTLKMEFSSGYTAEVVRIMEKAGTNPWAYPVERLSSAWEDGVCDPWSLPPWKAARALMDGNFRKSLFSRRVVGVLLPPDCRWWAETPFCRFENAEGGQKALLNEGVSVFLSEDDKLIVSVDGEKIAMRRGAPRM